MDAPWWSSISLASTGEDAGVSERTDHPPERETTPVFSGTAGILREAVFFDQQREFGFHDLDRRIGRIRDVRLHAILSVLERARTASAAVGFEIEVFLSIP